MSLRPEKRVKLSRTYAIHDKAVGELTLVEPTWDDYAELGEVFEARRGPEGTVVVLENREAVKGYVERCVRGLDPANLGLLGLPDARALRDTIVDFFQRPESSTAPSTGSSSGTAGVPPISAD